MYRFRPDATAVGGGASGNAWVDVSAGLDGSAVQAPFWMFDGSFLTTRRLAQDVPGFWSGVVDQHTLVTGAARTDPDSGIPSADALAAKLVGRWRSGTPTDKAPVVDNRSTRNSANDNDFDFRGHVTPRWHAELPPAMPAVPERGTPSSAPAARRRPR